MTIEKYGTIQDTVFSSPAAINATVSIPAINQLFTPIDTNTATENTHTQFTSDGRGTIVITYPNTMRVTVANNISTSSQLTFQSTGYYTIKYEFPVSYNVFRPGPGWTYYTKQLTFVYTILVVQNRIPLKRYTVTDVINRLLDVAEPKIRESGEPYIMPRFKLQGMERDGKRFPGSIAAYLDTIIAPQFTFTKQTLRECLQQIGKFIHGEPRLIPVEERLPPTYQKNWIYEVTFDFYGGNKRSRIADRRPTQRLAKHSINGYCTSIDSNAENLVNQLDKFSGTIAEPGQSGYKTVRTESVYARIEENNLIIPTQYPIYTIEKVEIGRLPNTSRYGLDITPYVFERSEYDAQLSSYSDQWPFSKAYGLYFTQGSKNIGGLSFKPPDPISPAFQNYAILNIIRRALGNNSYTLTSRSETPADRDNPKRVTPGDYPRLAFRVTYTPFYTARIAQSKVNYKDTPKLSSLVYNQGANVVETRYYGENLKGVVARMGNVEKTLTYMLSNINDIPEPGELYDDDYYISTVTWELLPTCIKCSIGLSKDFNRLSEYVGIDSEKRYSEVSQTQAVERKMIFRNYIVVSSNEEIAQSGADSDFISSAFMSAFMSVFETPDEDEDEQNRIDVVQTRGYSYSGIDAEGNITNGNIINDTTLFLPVIASAFGNSLSFSWTYEDNYSAGAYSTYQTNGNISGYFQNNVPYADYYGKIWSLWFSLGVSKLGSLQGDVETQKDIGNQLPISPGTSSTIYDARLTTTVPGYVIRKDNREKLQVNVQIDLVTDDSDLIIGSALAAYNPTVRDKDPSYVQANPIRLYVFQDRLPKFIDHVNASLPLSSGTAVADVAVETTGSIGKLTINGDTIPIPGKSWAIITDPFIRSYPVEDEQGNITFQKIQLGGDVLLAKNTEISAGQSFAPIYFTPKREVFDTSCWVDKK